MHREPDGIRLQLLVDTVYGRLERSDRLLVEFELILVLESVCSQLLGRHARFPDRRLHLRWLPESIKLYKCNVKVVSELHFPVKKNHHFY